MEPRVTIRDIAARANVHFTTVSMALRNKTRLPKETRERIQALAEEMGYRPDPVLGALNQYRHLRRGQAHQATLGWANNLTCKEETVHHPLLLAYYQGACQRAEKLGFKIDTLYLRAPDMSPERIHTILRTRNINGLLIAPQPRDAKEIKLNWDELSAVKFGHSLRKPELHTIVSHQYQSMRTMLQELRKLGYRRIGLVIERDFDMRANNNWQAAFWVDYNARAPEDRVEPFFFSAKPRVDSTGFSEWFHTQKPDVIGLVGHEFVDEVTALGLEIPKQLGLAICGTSEQVQLPQTPRSRLSGNSGLNGNSRQSSNRQRLTEKTAKKPLTVSGVYEDRIKIGRMAVDLLVSMLARQECGIPEHPHYLLAEGNWVRGDTVRRQKNTAGQMQSDRQAEAKRTATTVRKLKPTKSTQAAITPKKANTAPKTNATKQTP